MELYINDLPVPEDIKSYAIYDYPIFLKIIMGFLFVPESVLSSPNYGEDYDEQEVDNETPFVVSTELQRNGFYTEKNRGARAKTNQFDNISR